MMPSQPSSIVISMRAGPASSVMVETNRLVTLERRVGMPQSKVRGTVIRTVAATTVQKVADGRAYVLSAVRNATRLASVAVKLFAATSAPKDADRDESDASVCVMNVRVASAVGVPAKMQAKPGVAETEDGRPDAALHRATAVEVKLVLVTHLGAADAEARTASSATAARSRPGGAMGSD